MPINIYQRSAMAIAIAACFPMTGHAAGVARVDFAVGNVTAQSADGRTRTLARGSEIEVGDTVNTQQGRAQLRFQDGAFMSLQPETSFKVEQFRFTENGGGNDSIIMNLLKGGMRTITGLIGRANRQNYKFRTEVATIGIRGTEYSVRYTNSIEVFCAGGVISVENEGGELVLGTGQGGLVISPKEEPRRSEERPFLPPTAASGGQEPQEELAAPVNPVQESLPPVVFAGKFTGSWGVAYRTTVDSAANATIELDPTSGLIAFDDGRAGTILPGTSTALRDGGDSIISWGRWVNGITGGSGTFAGKDTRLAPLHWVAGLPTPSMPTGTASYAMIGATPPSCTGCAGATLNGSSLLVNFDAASVGLNMDITIAGIRYTTSLGDITLSIAGSTFSGSGSVGCVGPSMFAAGFFAGDGAARAGLAYHIGLVNQDVNGAIAYTKQ